MMLSATLPATQDITARDVHLAYLLAELARVEVYFRQRIARIQTQRPSSMGGLMVTEDDLAQLFASPESPMAEADEIYADLYTQRDSQSEMILEHAQVEPRFAAFCRCFELNQFERDIFLICLAPLLDVRYERLFGYLQDDITVRRPTVSVVLDVLLDSSTERLHALPYFLDQSKLFARRLLVHVQENGTYQALPNQQLSVDESVFAWLLGVYQPDPRLESVLTLSIPRLEDKDQLLTAEIWPVLTAAVNGQSLASFYGGDVQVQLAAARMLALNAELPMLQLDLSALTFSPELSAVEVIRLALRDAQMSESMLLIQGWDRLGEQSQGYTQVVRMLFAHAAPIVVSSEKEWYAHGVERSDAILRIAFGRPSFKQRSEIWSFYMNACNHDFAPGIDVQMLSSQFSLSSTQIADAVSSARDAAIQRGDIIQQRDLINAARIHSSPNLAGLARKIEPRYEWADIVLPDDQKAMLREMIQMVRGRGVVMESWGVGAKLKTSSGVTVLFAGPPGTGKTMSAEVIAGELGLDLYKIDLSVVVSKYIGETEKNLGKIFDEAQSSSAVLFFDEADSIFGKRSEVKDSHDRYANMEISYLLQRMELYDGITILATNLRANMDEAFTRRMQFIVDFPFPDVAERLHIWQTLFPAELPRSADLDLALLARRFKLAGGNIRNIIAGAAFLAAADGHAVTMDHLLHSTRREMQKMGRLISDVDLSF